MLSLTLAAAAPAAQAAKIKPGSYSGYIDGCSGKDCPSVEFKVARSGKSIPTLYVLDWVAVCESIFESPTVVGHNLFTGRTSTTPISLRKSKKGKFSYEGYYEPATLTGPASEYTGTAGTGASVGLIVVGKGTSKGTVKGDYTFVVGILDASGARVDTCKTYETWTARR